MRSRGGSFWGRPCAAPVCCLGAPAARVMIPHFRKCGIIGWPLRSLVGGANPGVKGVPAASGQRGLLRLVRRRGRSCQERPSTAPDCASAARAARVMIPHFRKCGIIAAVRGHTIAAFRMGRGTCKLLEYREMRSALDRGRSSCRLPARSCPRGEEVPAEGRAATDMRSCSCGQGGRMHDSTLSKVWNHRRGARHRALLLTSGMGGWKGRSASPILLA